MLVTIFSSLMITKRRNLVQIFPERLTKLFDVWEIRVAVLLSLTLQCIQILYGGNRKFSTSMKLRIIL
ncbi:DUF594 family protein [Quillaja saponaria]|uniref:DUF594 family protein n=1 Tax=Quillaja saponaria TaxID=32244 RepID=A0AAD7LS66_QUISA|nr:DUF594 family protein [Quillaja saponaria]